MSTSHLSSGKAQDSARLQAWVSLLAGLPPAADSPFAAYAERADWQAYAQAMQVAWDKVERERIAPMQAWSAIELADFQARGSELFYPFAGPDAFHAWVLFPKMQVYHLLALEPAGNIPLPGEEPAEGLGAYCQALQYALRDFFGGYFFNSLHMRRDTRGTQGVAILLAIFLVRLGHRLISLERVKINARGKVVRSREAEWTSIRWRFEEVGTGQIKTLYYHACDLDNEGLEASPPLLKHLRRLCRLPMFTKASGYGLQDKSGSVFRQLLLKYSPVILQDDTGLSYSLMDDKTWAKTFYGQYLGPIQFYASRKDESLRQAFAQAAPPLLPFALGYHAGHWSSAVKQDNLVKYWRLTVKSH